MINICIYIAILYCIWIIFFGGAEKMIEWKWLRYLDFLEQPFMEPNDDAASPVQIKIVTSVILGILVLYVIAEYIYD